MNEINALHDKQHTYYEWAKKDMDDNLSQVSIFILLINCACFHLLVCVERVKSLLF